MKKRAAAKKFIPRTREERELVRFVTSTDIILSEFARLAETAARLFPVSDAGIAREAASREVTEATDAGESLAATRASMLKRKRTKRTLGGE